MSADAEHALAAAVLWKPSRQAELDGVDFARVAEPGPRRVLELCRQYRVLHHGANSLDLPLALDLLERSGKPKAAKLARVLEEYRRAGPISEAEFRDARHRVREAQRLEALRRNGVVALEAAAEGKANRARSAMRRALLEAEDADDDAPVSLESREATAAELRETLKPPESGAVFDVGLRAITRRWSFRRSRLAVLGGSTGDGKTTVAKTLAYNAAVRSGANVLYLSLEMSCREMEVLIACQHAASIDPRGVQWARVLDATCSPRELALYRRARVDLAKVLKARGARLTVWAPDRAPDVGQVRDKVLGLAEEGQVDLVVIDFLELVRPERREGAKREYRHDLTEIAYAAKRLAREANVLVLALQQVSRQGREFAEKRTPRFYTLRDLAESAGVGQAADCVLWVYSDELLKEDRRARVGISKARQGEVCAEGEEVYASFAHGIVGDLSS